MVVNIANSGSNVVAPKQFVQQLYDLMAGVSHARRTAKVGWYIVDVKRTMHDQEPGRGTWRIEHLQEEILFNSVQVAVPVILTIIIGVVYTICRWWCMESGSDLRMHRD